MKVLGMLGVANDADGTEMFVVINPERAILLVDAETAPDEWVAIKDKAEAEGAVLVIGFLMDCDE